MLEILLTTLLILLISLFLFILRRNRSKESIWTLQELEEAPKVRRSLIIPWWLEKDWKERPLWTKITYGILIVFAIVVIVGTFWGFFNSVIFRSVFGRL